MVRWFVPLVVILTACDFTLGSSPTPTLPAASAESREILPLGDVLNIDAKEQAYNPVIAIGSDDAPIIAWIEANRLLAKKWDGTAWIQLGDQPLNIHPDSLASQPAITVDSEGAAIVAWRECCNPDGDLYAARWNGTGWAQLGGALEAFGGEIDTPRPSLIATTQGLFIAWRERSEKTDTQQIQVRRWDGGTWQPQGNLDTLNANPTRAAQELALSSLADGAPVIVWSEWDGTSGRATNAYSWTTDSQTWKLLPSPPEDSDDELNSIGLAASPDDTLFLARDTVKGPLIDMLTPRRTAWTNIAFPAEITESQYSCIAAPALAAQSEKHVIMLWGDRCDTSLSLSMWDGNAWSTPHNLGNTRQFDFDDYAMASAADGTVYLAYLADSQGIAQVHGAAYGAFAQE